MKATTICIALLLAATAHAQSTVRVLLPITLERTPGAEGSVWITDVWAFNSGARPAEIAPISFSHYKIPVGQPASLPIFYKRVGTIPPGSFVAIPADIAADVSFRLRVRNVGESPDSLGTQLPTPRESEFSRTIVLLSIPDLENARDLLRIYALPEDVKSTTTVRLRVYAPFEDVKLLADLEVPIAGSEFSLLPGYTQLRLSELVPSLKGKEHLSVRLDSDARIWAFGSFVRSGTQHVSVAFPEAPPRATD